MVFKKFASFFIGTSFQPDLNKCVIVAMAKYKVPAVYVTGHLPESYMLLTLNNPSRDRPTHNNWSPLHYIPHDSTGLDLRLPCQDIYLLYPLKKVL
jgi:hypothetical protein